MDEPRRRNPFRNEADAFRVLLIVAAGAVAVMLAGAIAGPALWVPVALVLIGLGARSTLIWLQGGLGAPPPAEGAAEAREDREEPSEAVREADRGG